jgi:hypothetical protein
MNRTNDRVESILSTSSVTDCDEKKIELLEEFQRGRPLPELLPLLVSDNGNAVEVGIWIASELGASGKPLLENIVPLLRHPRRTVRFFALDCVLQWASGVDGAAIASAIPLTEDEDAAVRWKALRFLSAASPEQLLAAQSQMASTGIQLRHASALAWILSEEARTPAKVVAQLRNPDALLRKYGAVAAARMLRINRNPLADAAGSSDPEVKQFALDMLSLS